ncbi:MAG TPA: hypothetical protein DD435_14060 [Cyanobacteria bacterium UBA8530]|nr:hypothetical protein [Cyanobacteria bacterium UBA8530]
MDLKIGPSETPNNPNPAQMKLKKACKDFEAIMVGQLLALAQPKRSSETLGGSSTDQTYQGMLYDELAKRISAGPGMGVAEVLYRQLKDQVASTSIPEGEKEDVHRQLPPLQ